MNIEPLESRIAPAAVFVNATTATYTDVDGDAVTVKFTKPLLTAGNVTTVLVTAGSGGRDQLQTIDLVAAGGTSGTDISVTAKPNAVSGGDGRVNVGCIRATGFDIGAVRVQGDLGVMDAGDPSKPASACKSLTVDSLGCFGLSTGAPSLNGILDGRLDKLTVKFDVRDAFFFVTDSAGTNGTIGSVSIGGSLIGSAMDDTGHIFARDGFGPVKIGGNIEAGDGSISGSISSNGPLASLRLGGSLLGGSDVGSGQIFCKGANGPITIVGDIVGGSGEGAGQVITGATLASLTLGGSLIGGAGLNSGLVFAGSSIGAVKIGGNVAGGDGQQSGRIFSGSTLASLKINGSLIGGTNVLSGTVSSNSELTSVKIGGSVVGGIGEDSGKISTVIPTAGRLGSLSIGGSLAGGGGSRSGQVNSFAIGTVKIGHDVQGGSGDSSGVVRGGTLAGVTIGGSLIGGTGGFSGQIDGGLSIGAVKIGRDVLGASISSGFSGFLTGSAAIEAVRIGSITIGGSILAGVDNSSNGSLGRNATIRADHGVGSIIVKGSVVGSVGSGGDVTKVIFTAADEVSPTAISDLAFGEISIGGRVEHAQILAGYDDNFTPLNADAQIGLVTVGGDWIASNLIAGVQTGANGTFGDSDDEKLSGAGVKNNADLGGRGAISKIAAVVIKGRGFGTTDTNDTVEFGIEAQHLVSIKVGGVTIPLTPGAGNDLHANRRPLGVTLNTGGFFDFSAFEVPLT